MNTLLYSTQFKKDLKRYKHRSEVLSKLEIILNMLVSGAPIPPQYRPHMLTGNYRGHMECHVESDTLLIWFDKEENTVTLVRFGSHSELFSK